MAEPQLEMLVRAASELPAGSCIVEVGTYRARSTVALALGSRHGCGVPVYTFDPHTEQAGVRGGSFGPDDQAAVYANITLAQVGELVHVVGLDSTIVAPGWSGQVGLLLIDGDHRAEAVEADFRTWQPHLGVGASVFFDDVDYEGVRTVVDALMERGELAADEQLGSLQRLAVPD